MMEVNNDENDDLLYEIDEKGQRVLVRSVESNLRAFLRFTNTTTRPVDVWWRDFHGAKRLYVRLAPGTHYDVDSFVTHPWEFTDAITKERYVVNNRIIYRPPRKIGGLKRRTKWNITISVRTLRHTALLALATQSSDPSTAHELGLPRVLAEDLQRLIALLHRPPTPRD